MYGFRLIAALSKAHERRSRSRSFAFGSQRWSVRARTIKDLRVLLIALGEQDTSTKKT